MKYLVILLISVIYLVNADNGDYVPRSVYFIDENGNPSVPHPINSGLLNRVRRQLPGPGFGPGFAFPQPVFNFPSGFPAQGQGSFVQSSQTLSSRFGEDEPVVTGQTQTFHSSGGKYQHTQTVLRPDGTVQTNKQTGKVKRQANQVQSQGDENGANQLQSQSNDRPSGTQFQSQSQPGLSQTQSQGAGPAPQQPQAVDRQNLPQQPQPADRAQNLGPQGQQGHPQGGQQGHPQGGQQGGQPNYPQGGQQGHPQGGQPNYPQGGQPNYPQGGQPGFQPGFGAFPFGFGGFAPGFGFPQQGFGFPQAGFGFPGGFPQQGFGGVPQGQPGFAPGSLDNRFGEDEVPTGVVGVGQTITSQNGQYHATSSILKPDGQVVTTQHSGAHKG
ncbi:basic salivary proline-rich protein 1-like isoform X2 [Chironomus tepperi]|uniref:basic salivary proline-rich protein 1-like isoform X2 n=1 Tax=Chironomus tepperi TaxID=113505 RepID=UPI00391F5ADA